MLHYVKIYSEKCLARQSLYSHLWERGRKQMGLEFSLQWSETARWRHFWWRHCSEFLLRRWGTLGGRS